MDELAVADVDAHVGAAVEEDHVARLLGAARDVGEGAPDRAGVVGDALADLGERIGGQAAAVEAAGRGAAPHVRRAELLQGDGDRPGVAAPARQRRPGVAAGVRRGEGGLLGGRDPTLALLLGADHLPQLALDVVQDGLALGQEALDLLLLRGGVLHLGRGLALVDEQLRPEGLETGLRVLERAHDPGVHLADLVEHVELAGRGGDAAGLDEDLGERRRGVHVEAAQPLGQPRARPLEVGLGPMGSVACSARPEP